MSIRCALDILAQRMRIMEENCDGFTNFSYGSKCARQSRICMKSGWENVHGKITYLDFGNVIVEILKAGKPAPLHPQSDGFNIHRLVVLHK